MLFLVVVLIVCVCNSCPFPNWISRDDWRIPLAIATLPKQLQCGVSWLPNADHHKEDCPELCKYCSLLVKNPTKISHLFLYAEIIWSRVYCQLPDQDKKLFWITTRKPPDVYGKHLDLPCSMRPWQQHQSSTRWEATDHGGLIATMET